MNPPIAVLDLQDYGILALLVFAAVIIASSITQQRVNLRRLERKLDALLQHEGIEMPSRLSPEAQQMAADPCQKIAAIKLHREQNPELSLAEAKAEIEAFAKTLR